MSKHYPNKKVIAVMPAYNAKRTLADALGGIDMDWVDEVVLVDDASGDGTSDRARELGIKNVFVHPKNRGYGGNQKTCYREAGRLGADIVVMIHPDHQYDPKYIPEMILPIIRGEADAVFGSRMMIPGGALKGGMPYWKYMVNKFLTLLENIILRQRLTEYHSGLRAYAVSVLEEMPITENSDAFVFDTEIIAQLKVFGKQIKEIPIHTKYFPGVKGVGFDKMGIDYGLGILKTMVDYLLFSWGFKQDKRFVKHEKHENKYEDISSCASV